MRRIDVRGPGRCLVLVFLLLFIQGVCAAQAQESAAPAQSDPLVAWAASLDYVAESLGAEEHTDLQLANYRQGLEDLRDRVRRWVEDRQPELAQARAELDTLGPVPAQAGVPEAASLTRQRQQSTAHLAALEAQIRRAELAANRATRLLADVARLRRDRFADQVLSRGPAPMSTALWSRAYGELHSRAGSARSVASDMWNSMSFRARLRQSAWLLGGTVVLAIVLVWPTHQWLLRRYGRDPAITAPRFIDAARATLVVGMARSLLPAAAAVLVYTTIHAQGLLTEAGAEIGKALLFAFILATFTLAFFRASLSPYHPAWRIVPLPDNFAYGIRGVLIALTLLFAIDVVFSRMIEIYGATLEVLMLRDFLLATLVIVALLVLLLRQQMWTPDETPSGRPRWRTLRTLAALALVVVFVLGAAGYVALMRFVATQFVLTGGLVFLLLILQRMGGELLNQAVAADTWLGDHLRGALRVDDASASRLHFWVSAAYDALLVMIGLVSGLFIWGAQWRDVVVWIRKAFFGFEVGNIRIAIVDVLLAVIVFFVVLLLTRILARSLREKILPQTYLDPSTQQSLVIGIGYAGSIVAVVAALGALGFGLSNVAIVAGALSVGIGFGMQNIVNNFVSGLILLAERPIRIGDRIVAGENQGWVRKIKVRSTEIETLERATMFVPNSELLSHPLTNWTYSNRIALVNVPVGVAYGTDTRAVRDILVGVARAHDQILQSPPPMAAFRAFGDSALEFELRCYISDVDQQIPVTSDLCFAIDDAFRAAGIEIPFPQHDIHVKRLPDAGSGSTGSTA